jgi:LSD1 subclass zinc finger protein
MGAAGPAQGICKPEPGARAGAFNYFTGISGCRNLNRLFRTSYTVSCGVCHVTLFIVTAFINLVYLVHSHLFLVAFILTQCTIGFGHGP